ncbi:MAG: flagellar type III secretion system pore protein FliP [bacterium]|nr:flagellar type III secretion system pore protein FliP [bacterium]
MVAGSFSLCESAFAQSLTLDMGSEGGSLAGRVVQMVLLVTILTLAPSILVMVTSFTRLVVVFSFLRSAIGLQQSPPNTVLVSLALFLTAFVMSPVLEKVYDDGLSPLIEEKIPVEEALEKMSSPIKAFMMQHVREDDLGLFLSMSQQDPKTIEKEDDISLRALIPAFMISELRRAFEIGFLIFLPFVIIDMVVASILMSMGMMMLPPVMISLPFKLIFFVQVDGWHLVVSSLVKGFGIGGGVG